MSSQGFRPKLEVLEDRTCPYINAYRTALLVITPPTVTTVSQPIEIDISKQLANVTLPNGESFPLHGLKKADAKSEAVAWQPT